MSADDALRQAEKLVADGADVIDIGGESTRPGSRRIDTSVEIERVLPVISALCKQIDIPVSIDTSRSEVARIAVDAGAEIINDISGLRWDMALADTAAETNAGLILMHSRGSFETMHAEPPISDAVGEVTAGLHRSIDAACERGVSPTNIVADIGLGFGKTARQNFELISKLGTIIESLRPYPLVVGASRKSFLKEAIGNVEPAERVAASVQVAVMAVQNGAKIVRVHDVAETVQGLRVCRMINDGEW